MKNKSQIIKGCALALIPTSICSAIAGVNFVNRAYAETSSSGYVKSYHESVTISNASFATASNPYSSGNTFSGWSAIETESKAFGAIINTIDDNSSNSFAKNKSSYHIDENPGYYGSDTRVLMINSLTKDGRSQEAKKGYRSSGITLQANSYYKFSVAVKTALTQTQANAGASVSASIYLNGLKDKNGEDLSVGYEGITTNNVWKEVTFFVATGNESQSVTFDLYLGSASGQTSQGAVFFDEAQGTRYSQNEFYDEIERAGYSNDDYKTFHNDTQKPIFLVNDLLENKPYIANMGDYNFDFEKDIEDATNTLGEEFMIANKQNGHALIQNILNMQPSDFKALTGYDYVGTDLGNGNEQALLLYTGEKVNGKMENASGYVGVESKEIDIKAHAIYKISLKVKVAKIEEGSFYLKVQENDNILATYSQLLTEDSTDKSKETYTLKSGKTSSITSNTENSFENDYQTLTFFVKGHSLFDSSINLELWLGDTETNAKGCVVVDNITVEYATNDDYSNASNKLELTSTLPSDQGITNGGFNASENDKAEENYLVKASSWTVDKESDDYCDSGIVYLYNKATYDEMYTSNREKYPWAGIFPNQTKVSSVIKPNNAYLMNNRTKTSQSILSNTFDISANGYHKLAFSYYNQNGTDLTASSKIKVEVIDENGTVLFSKNDISSLDKWETFEVYFHTHSLLSHTAQVKISLGDSDEKVCGMVYLDDFTFTTSDDYAENFENRTNKVDLSKLGLNEKATNEVSLSGFYTFADANGNFTTPVTQTGTGGLVNGRDNSYNEFNDKLKIDGNYLVLSSRNTGYVKMTSNYKLSFKENEFYKISLDLATIFNSSALSAKTDDHDCKYGVSVEIDGFEAVDKLLSADEFKTLEIFYKASSTSSVNLVIKLNTDCEDTYGTALISNLDFASITESDYKSAQRSDSLNDKVYIANQKETTADGDNTNDDDSDDNTNTSTSDNAWILVPSIITGLAVIIGVVGYAMKHVKLKKIEKVRKESYDRKLAVNHDAIMVQAQKRRDEELDALNKAKESLIKDKETLEEEHKQFIKSAREKDGEKISREIEKAFKSYNHSINKLNEKINIIKEKIDYTISAEYLLVVERRILAEQDEKASKKKKTKENFQ